MIERKLQMIRERVENIMGEDIYLPPLNDFEAQEFRDLFKRELNSEVEDAYINLLKISDGLVCQGVFIYSAISRPYPDENDGSGSMEIIDINQIFRESKALDESIVLYGDSDADQFLHDRSSGKFKIVAKGAIDVVYEEYDTMEDLINGIIDQIEERI